MFQETEFIADQILRSWRGDAWHGPALDELLRDVTEELSARKARPDVHSIREIVQHITSWESAILHAIEGVPMPGESWAEDWPETRAPWHSIREKLRSATEELVAAVRAMPTEQLTATAPGRDYDYRFLLYGAAQHNCYHGGQIALLKKP
jgi:uncharacterized damage-inducible protein DinB